MLEIDPALLSYMGELFFKGLAVVFDLSALSCLIGFLCTPGWILCCSPVTFPMCTCSACTLGDLILSIGWPLLGTEPCSA
jgi:hypothetical protein